MDDPAENTRSTAPLTGGVPGSLGEKAGDTIGPYRLLEILGEGGFGTVWLAERREPFVQRVALKIIKAGMDTREVIARFEQERQALAVMDHPNVAKVHDAGTTPTGRPYFVMEHVKGEPVTDFCDRHTYTIRQRLALFIPICEAVQHAHMKGIIHRDLKPSNILVTLKDGHAIPKVIDFGVAKAVSHTLTDKTIFTETGQLIGTPEYMSPEQAEMGALDVDTRTDVYSLGVVLYELLTGLLPFDRATLRAKGYDETRRIIREVDPPTPSKRLTTINQPNQPGASAQPARQGGGQDSPSAPKEPLATRIARTHATPLPELTRLLRRELEWVPLKALRKDRAQRYSSPEALAADVRRFLDGRALEAGPESAAYRARKFARRYRGPLLACAAVLLALSAGLATTLWQKYEAQQLARAESQARRDVETQKTLVEVQRNEADAARQRAEAINEFVTKSLQSSDPNQGGAQAITVADAMTQALANLDRGDLKDQPATVATLLRTIATILNGNGRSAEAEAPAMRALKNLRELHNGDDPDVAASLSTLAAVLESLGRSAEAEPLLVQSLEMYRRLLKGDHTVVATTVGILADVLQSLGRAAEAELLSVQALEMHQRLFKGDHPDVAGSLNGLARLRQSLGRVADAEPLLVQSLEMYQRLFKGDHPALAMALNNLASVREGLGRAAEAEPLYVQALAMEQRLFSGDHAAVALALGNVAFVRESLGRTADAEPLFVQALEMQQRLFKGDHPNVATSMDNLASVRRSLGRAAEAEPLHLHALEMYQRLFRGDHPSVAIALGNLASAREMVGRAAEAEPLYVQALEMSQRLFKGDHPAVAVCLNNLAMVRKSLGRAADAELLYVQALEMQQRLYEGDHPHTASAMINLAHTRLSLGRAAEAEPLFVQALEMHQRLFKGDHPDVSNSLNNLASVRESLGRTAEAESLYVQALEMRQRLYKGGHPTIANTMKNLAHCLAALNRLPEALARAQEASEMAARILPEGHPTRKKCDDALAEIKKKLEAKPEESPPPK